MVFKALVFLCVLHLTASKILNEVKHTKLSNPTIDSKCLLAARTVAECPVMEDPVCVKVKYRSGGNSNSTIFMSLINRCELSYVKCYHDVKAEEVPMKYCDHRYIREMKAEQVKPSKRRSKRSLSNNEIRSDKDSQQEDYRRLKIRVNVNKVSNGADEAETPPDLEEPAEPSKDTNEAPPEKDSPDEGDNGENEENSGQVPPEKEKPIEVAPEEKGSNEKSVEQDPKSEAPVDADPEVNEEQNNADCPTVCPARDLMVCARCSHGIYRTFMSVCHVRRFACNSDDSIELISRYPCMLSSPYWNKSAGEETQGKIRHENDFDRVLRYVECRAEGRVKDDPSKLVLKVTKRTDAFADKCVMFGENND